MVLLNNWLVNTDSRSDYYYHRYFTTVYINLYWQAWNVVWRIEFVVESKAIRKLQKNQFHLNFMFLFYIHYQWRIQDFL